MARRGRKTEAAAEPLRAEKGVMQPRTAATGTLRADRDGATGDAEGSQGWLLTRDTKERADRDGRDGDKESSHIRLLTGTLRAAEDGCDGDVESSQTWLRHEREGEGGRDGRAAMDGWDGDKIKDWIRSR